MHTRTLHSFTLFEPLLQSRASVGDRAPSIYSFEMPIKPRSICDSYAIVVMQPKMFSQEDCQIFLVSGFFTVAMLASYVQRLCRGPAYLDRATGECHWWNGPDARSVCKNSLFVSFCVHLYYNLQMCIYFDASTMQRTIQDQELQKDSWTSSFGLWVSAVAQSHYIVWYELSLFWYYILYIYTHCDGTYV